MSAQSGSQVSASALANTSSQLLASAFRLAYFIHPDTDTALRIASDALANLELALQVQDKRLYYSPVGQFFSRQHSSFKPRNRVRVSDLHLLQRLVYMESEAHERDHELSGRGAVTEEDLIIRFIKHVVKITLRRNSFYVALGFSRLLHSYSTPETMEIYNLVIQDPSRMKQDSYYRTCKRQLMHEMKQRFGPALKTVTLARGEERFEIEPDPNSRARLVRKALAMFTPWDTGCSMPERFDASEESLPMFKFDGNDPDKEHPIEINRIHSIIDPVCYTRLIGALGLDPPEERLALPRFSMDDEEGGGGDRADREHPPELTEEQISGALKGLADRADRRKRMKAKLLLIVVDGVERARLTPTPGARAVLEVGESAEMVEVRARDDDGEERIGLHLLDYRLDRPGAPKRYGVELEGGQKLSLEVRAKRTGDGEMGGAVLSIEYGEAGLFEAAKQYLGRMKEAGRSAAGLAAPEGAARDFVRPGFAMGLQAGGSRGRRSEAPALLIPAPQPEGEEMVGRLMPGATPEDLRMVKSSKLIASLLARNLLRAADLGEAQIKLSYLLIDIAEKSHSLRDTRTVKEAGEILSSMPLKQAHSAGLLFRAIIDKKEGNLGRARATLNELIADPNVLPYIKVRGVSNLAATWCIGGEFTEAARIYEESFRLQRSLSRLDPYNFLVALVELAAVHAKMGDDELALRMLMEALPLTEMIRLTRPHLRFVYLNNIAAELMRLGEIEEAARYIRPVCLSPLASKYPEWIETAVEIEEVYGRSPLDV